MLCLWLLAGLLQGCLSGDVLYPASSVEAHGPLARLALQPHYSHDVTSFHHLPVTAETAHVYQVPAVAQVPVLKYTTQPQYVQRLVDVANTQVAVAKLQVRRPAIQKQFYDIEERTIVRPVGSAVLELEEPVSQKYVSPFSVVPAGHHTTAQFHRPLVYPVSSYPLVSYGPLQVPVQHYPPAHIQQNPQPPQQYPINSQDQQLPPFSQPPPQYPPTSQPPQQLPPFSHPPQQLPPFSHPPPQYPPTSQPPQQLPPFSHPPQQLPPFSHPPQQYPVTSQPPQQVPTIPQFPQQPANTETQPPQQLQPGSQLSPDNSFNTEFDSSDTVVVENPDFTRSRKPSEESEKDNKNEDSFEEFEREVSKGQTENKQKDTEQDRVVQNIISDFENLQLLRMFSSQTGNEKPLQRSQQRPNFQVLLEPPKIQDQPQQIQKKPSEETQSFQRSREEDKSHISTQTGNSVESSSALSSHSPSSSTTERELPSLFTSYLNHLRNDHSTGAKIGTDELISSTRHLSSEESQDNQRKLLELLTGRGEVSEVSVATSGPVRGRVLSVTTAPCAEAEERVNTRRVVVSRPVHTVEELDVQRPFTQLHRVAVHEPVHTFAYH